MKAYKGRGGKVPHILDHCTGEWPHSRSGRFILV